MSKTVYILGAGFSKSTNAPLQSEIIKEILGLNVAELEYQFQETFRDYLAKFKKFMTDVYYISEADLKKVALEDIYTPIDRCILDNISYRNIQPKELIELRKIVSGLIVIMMHHKLYEHKLKLRHVNTFSNYLIAERSESVYADPFSIISMNWDIILDNALKKGILGSQGVVDYCCYINSYNTDENLMPGLLARGLQKYNVKILKLHGSMNWLQCKRCQRLFVTFFDKIALHELIKEPKCRMCEKNFHNTDTTDGGAILASQLIMPTFLKDLNNVQIKLIWQNAGVELSEADKIIFMGYSFPMADFELRQLLARFVRHNAEIVVILHKNDTPKPGMKEYFPENRYRNFFGNRKINFNYDGVEKYIINNYT